MTTKSRPIRPAAFLSVLFACLPHLTVAETQITPTREDLRRTYELLDALGFPAGRELRLIRVSFEQPGDQPGSWENADPIEGFLVSEDENSIRVFSYQLTVVTVSKGDPGSSDSRHATYAVLDFAREVDPDPSHPFQFVTPTFFGESVSVNEKMLSLARASARVGKVGIERRLLSGCLGECDLDWTGKRSECFFDLLVDGLGYHMAQQAVLLECCPRASHRQALDYVSVLARAFPAGKWRKRFKQDAEVLERMVLEEETTHTRSSKPLNELPVEERVAELIFSLRDAAVGDSWPHSNWIFSEADVDGALTDLVELGPPAVPQLIEAVGDASFTRTVQTRHSLFTSWTEVRVGDLTVRVLESIAKRPFCSPSNTLATMFTDGDVGGTQRRVRAWWAAFQKGGERLALLEGAAAGDEYAPPQAADLLEKVTVHHGGREKRRPPGGPSPALRTHDCPQAIASDFFLTG